MIEESTFRVVNNNVRVFGGEAIVPPGDYHGGIEYYMIGSQRMPASAEMRVDRNVLESQGVKIAPNLPAIDFGVLEHIERGNIVVA